MKEKHKQAYKTDAVATLENCGVPIGASFHQLTKSQVDKLLVAADLRRYQKPKNANGSRRADGASMNAIVTKKLAPTNTKGTRIMARCAERTRYEPYDHAFSLIENHERAAMRLAFSMNLFAMTPDGRLDVLEWRDQWACGALPKNSSGLAYAFVRRKDL